MKKSKKKEKKKIETEIKYVIKDCNSFEKMISRIASYITKYYDKK